MFAKLLKHEWRSNAMTLGILSLAALGVGILGAVMMRILTYYEDRLSQAAMSSLGVALFFIILALIAYVAAVEILLLVRFYRNKFTDEGYLTFTLPVNCHQIFLSSFLNMLIWTVISLVVAFAAGLIIVLFGSDLSDLGSYGEVEEEFSFFFSGLTESIPIYLLQGAVSLVYNIVIALTCLTLGATIAKKHKILAAFGVFYGISFAVSSIENFSSVAISLANMDHYESYYGNFGYSGMADTLLKVQWQTALVNIAVQLVIITVGYLLSTNQMKRRLNLP